MDFTSSFVMQQYADMPKDEDESSLSSESSEESESEEEEEKINPISLETQYINAMVAKINAENEKNHPERNSKNVWEMLYGDMENFDASSSDDDVKKKVNFFHLLLSFLFCYFIDFVRFFLTERKRKFIRRRRR
jgi:hypothetical protein